jgi:hypothetical protein
MQKTLIRTLAVFAVATLVASQSFATYIVVLRNGTRYVAKSKWTVVNGKAIVQLENGQSLQLDPALIDAAKSEQQTRLGMANANVLEVGTPEPASKTKQPSLGDIKLRPRETPAPARATPAPAASAPAAGAPSPVPTVAGSLPGEVIEKFERAFENVGIFEKTVVSTGARSLRAELTVDTEERVFNAISATSFLMVRNAGVDGVQLDMVEIYMKTTTGGAAGRFQMSRADAEALDKKTMSQQDYFVKKVIY